MQCNGLYQWCLVALLLCIGLKSEAAVSPRAPWGGIIIDRLFLMMMMMTADHDATYDDVFSDNYDDEFRLSMTAYKALSTWIYVSETKERWRVK